MIRAPIPVEAPARLDSASAAGKFERIVSDVAVIRRFGRFGTALGRFAGKGTAVGGSIVEGGWYDSCERGFS